MRRTASAVWKGKLPAGSGTVSTETNTLNNTPYSFQTRFENEKTGTNPEELLGAAHAGCFSMAFAFALQQAEFDPQKISTRAEVEVVNVPEGFEIPTVSLFVEATVPGISEEKFQEIATYAKENCPLSKVLKAEISMEATLKS